MNRSLPRNEWFIAHKRTVREGAKNRPAGCDEPVFCLKIIFFGQAEVRQNTLSVARMKFFADLFFANFYLHLTKGDY